MQTICDYLMHDHKRCDELFVHVEATIAQKDWLEAELAFQRFSEAMLGHLDSEESIVFPAFENALPDAASPIAMLRMEHQRIKGIVARMEDALCRQNHGDLILHAETFTILMQQHSMKEEDMLYPLLDRILQGNTQHIVSALQDAIEHPTVIQ